MEQHNHNLLSSQSTLDEDDFSKSHWNAIRSVDIAQVMCKFPTYTFKKLYRIGTQLGFIYDTITQKIVQYSSKSSQSNPEALELYLKLWVLFSSLFLRISKSSSISIIKHRIKQYKSLQWELMISDLLYDCKELSKPIRTRKRNSYKGIIPVVERSPESRYETAAINFEDKDISKAYKTIVHPSTTSTVVSSESIQALRDLHPQRKPANEIPAELLKAARETVVPPLSTPQKLWRIIKNLRNGTAPGIDGLRSEHLVSMARHGKAKWISSMSTIINLALASALPTWLNEIFAYSKLIGLVKQSDENGKLKLRPIGIGMVWPKIISKTILNYYRPRTKDYFEPHQFGLSQSGLESITHITKEALKEHPDWVLLRLDLVNAFNSIFRKIIFEEVYKHFPLLLPWLYCLYGDFSHLWTKSDEGEFYFPLSSEEGVKQGCTLGSFLFCLAIHNPVIKKINELLTSSLGDTSSSSTGFAFGLLDDINIIADPAVLTYDFWDKIREVLSSCGLSINMEKATLYTSTCSDESLSILRSELPQSLKFHSDGVELVGTPIGNDEFCKTYWETNLLNEMKTAIPLICSWPDVQRALCLFRLCIVSKYNYFLRHSDPRSMYAARISESIHQLVQHGLAYILDPLTTEECQTIITEKIWSQSVLPPKMGGLGIQDPLLTHLPAFIAAASVGTSSYLHLKNVIKAGYENVPNCSGSSVDLFRPAHSDVHLALSENGTEKLFNTFKDKHGIQDVTVNDLIVQPRLQTFLASHMYSSINSAFRKTLTNQDLDRLNSCCYEGAVLITALPCHEDFCINGDHLFRERLLMRLGLPIPGVVSGKCLCKHGSNDIYGYHLLSVCNVGNQRINTHNAVRDSFREMCKAAGLSTRIEDLDTLKQNNIDTKSRVDIVCDNFLPGIPMAFDHSIADPRQSGLVAKTIPGKAAKKREISKITKYKNDLARQGMRFGPFVLESYGRWGYRTRVYFKHLIAKIIENSKLHACSLDGSVITHYWRCKITLAMHRQACLGMNSRIHALQRHYQLKASLTTTNLTAKVIQNYPFQNNCTVLDDSYRFESYVTSDSANKQSSNSSVIQYQENPLLKEPSTISSPFLTLAARSISREHNSESPLSPFCANTESPSESNTLHHLKSYSSIHVYTDGSCKHNKRGNQLGLPAGWGVAVLREDCLLRGDDNKVIKSYSTLAELYGPVVTDPNSTFFMGATEQTNNTGELTAVGEALLWLTLYLPTLRTSRTTPLTNIVIYCDSNYAINTCTSIWSGPFNVQLYSHIRRLLVTLENCIQSSKSAENCGVESLPSLSFQKVKAHSNIKGNVKADMLAERGQYEVCNVGRYSAAVLENISPSVQFHNSPSQHSNSENISAVSTNLDKGNNKHETFIIPNFSEINLNSPSARNRFGSDSSLSSCPSNQSSPWIFPLGLEDYDKCEV
jgi:ribonuclease HI